MIAHALDSAVFELLWLQSRGRRRRMWGRFCQRRRLILSAIACVLAAVWLGNAAMTVWFRETATPQTLRALLSLGAVIYAGWHFAKAAFFRPENPFDWTPGEHDLLVAMPLRPRDLVAYQLASVTATTLLKAGLFTILLLPDLRSVPLGLVGLVLMMLLLEMLRIAIEIATWGMGRAVFLAYRAAVVGGLVAAGCAVVAVVVRENALAGRINFGEGLLERILTIMVTLNESAFGYAAAPLRPLVDLIMADAVTAGSVGLALAASAAITVLAVAVIALYSATSNAIARRERRAYGVTALADVAAGDILTGSLRTELRPTTGARRALRLRSIPRMRGAGALAWRQLVGARRHWGSLLTALIAPAVLASTPCFVISHAETALLVTSGTLAFYTFLLLPTAIRFDFRRDLDRLSTLKGLPISPAAAAIGQTLAPVLIATLFQSFVLAIAVAVRSLPPHYWLAMMLVMAPLNVLVFGLDNLIYLLYPYRVGQEGVEVFLRTILTFTGKGLLFAAGLGAMSAWGLAAAALTTTIARVTGQATNAYAIFTGGMIAGPSLAAALVICGLAHTYQRMNPIEDVPR
jgi:hypothetical protein